MPIINNYKQRKVDNMGLGTSVINSAVNKKFTEFSVAIKQELHNKLSNHEDIKKYASDYDKIQQMKAAFAKINGSTEE